MIGPQGSHEVRWGSVPPKGPRPMIQRKAIGSVPTVPDSSYLGMILIVVNPLHPGKSDGSDHTQELQMICKLWHRLYIVVDARYMKARGAKQRKDVSEKLTKQI